MMNAEQYVVDHHLATVISQSFASAEDAFDSEQSLAETAARVRFRRSQRRHRAWLLWRRRHRQRNKDAGRQRWLADPVPDRGVARVRSPGHRRRRHVPLHRSGQHRDAIGVLRASRRGAMPIRARPKSAGRSPVAATATSSASRPTRTRCQPAAPRSVACAACRTSRSRRAQAQARSCTSPLPPDGQSGLICGADTVQHRLVRHRRDIPVVPAVGRSRGDRRPDQWRRTRPHQPGASTRSAPIQPATPTTSSTSPRATTPRTRVCRAIQRQPGGIRLPALAHPMPQTFYPTSY